MPASTSDSSIAEAVAEARRLGLGAADGAHTVRRLAAHVLLYVACGLAAEVVGGGPIVRLAAWMVQALILLGALAASHEAIHNNLFRAKRRNRLAGTLLAGLAGVPFSAYRAYHLAHHADTRGPRDPEPKEQIAGPAFWALAMLLGGLTFLAQTWGAVAQVLVGHPPEWVANAVHRRALRRAGYLALVVGLLLVGGLLTHPDAMLRWWIGPQAILWLGMASFVVIPEHNGLTMSASPFASTRTTTSNAPFRWFFWNNNLHTAHHLVPSVPWYQLEELQEAIEPRCEHLASGYFSYHLDAVRGRPR